ncbi:hypothetical protein [Pseudomonas sp. UBA2684]|uniref:hypothetical protein n=1 Tax=Pseudomonas sp. UBA2684 TaxID=1947311 RepID=UPI000E7DE5F3|nr:hypothetical protein [Pseudomonas sp. UBA2684]HBX56790.1 hypothetical protein [Pseudomonas sp.]|tara:strand:- start:2713 stop:3297 length:585 start_codon:yes stop_codon:yes gene_type:complete
MNPAIALPEASPSRRRRGRLQLILILAVVIGPMLLASAMYQWRFWVPETRSYHGELLGNGQTRADLGVSGAEEVRWQLLVTTPGACDADCQQLVFLARQIHIGLNRDVARAGHALASAQPLAADYDAQLRREYPQLGRYALEPQAYGKTAGQVEGAQLWIVDPHGNLVLRYDSSSKGKAILNDLRYLLKISQIG